MGGPNGERRRRTDAPTHKTLLVVIGLLWTALASVLGFSIGGSTTTARLEAHVESAGHPVTLEKMDGLQTLLSIRLQSIDRRLGRIERTLDGGG